MLGAPAALIRRQLFSRRSQRGELLSALLLVLVVLTLVTLVVLPNVRSKRIESRDACVVQLKQLDGAKKAWAVKNKQGDEAVPIEADLVGPSKFLKQMPVCSDGGIYRLNAVKDLPTCSLPGNPHHHILRNPGPVRSGAGTKAWKNQPAMLRGSFSVIGDCNLIL